MLTDECTIFTGLLDKKGYGIVRINGKNVFVHRLAYMLAHGEWPRICRHTCDVPACINPGHLLDGSKGDNNRDTVAHGRHVNASKTHCKHGHEFTPENTYVAPGQPNKRYCRACTRINGRNAKARKRLGIQVHPDAPAVQSNS